MNAGLAATVVLAVLALLAPRRTGAADSPKLAVLIVVDQMRADYVDRFGADWAAGLRRLVSDGAVFTNAAYPYFQTWTCSGHATIATGAFPHRHGIVQNEWPQGNPQQEPWCVDDPGAADLGYTKRANGGHTAWQLRVPTFADAMRTSKGSRVISVSLKADAAIMLAGHAGEAVTWVSDQLDTLATSTAYSPRPIAAVDRFAKANPIDAYARRTWDRLLPASRYAEVDDAVGEIPPPGWSRTFPHVLSAGGFLSDAEFRLQWLRTPFVDDYVGRLAGALVDDLQLGRRSTPDVLAVSFSGVDEVGHVFGPRSQEVHDTVDRLDQTIGVLLNHLDATVGRNQYVLALTADHGVSPIPEQARRDGADAGRIDPTAIALRIETILTSAWGRGRYVAALAGTNMNVYFLPGVYDRLRAAPALADRVADAVGQMDGVRRMLRSEQVRDGARSADPIVRAVALSYVPGRSGDLIVVLKPGWNATTTPAMHGNLTADDQRVPLIVFGGSIKGGRYTQDVTPADIAPTLADLFGVKLPDAEGRVLREAFR